MVSELEIRLEANVIELDELERPNHFGGRKPTRPAYLARVGAFPYPVRPSPLAMGCVRWLLASRISGVDHLSAIGGAFPPKIMTLNFAI